MSKFNVSVPFTGHRIEKDEEGNTTGMYISALISDSRVDHHNDRMMKSALESMLESIKSKEIKVRGLIDNHRSTFPFGDIEDGIISKAEDGEYELFTEFKLNPAFPQSHILFEDVSKGNNNYQLSIGGDLDLSEKDVISFSKDEKTGKIIRNIHKVLLEHVATTPLKHAANERTKFTSAIMKEIGIEDFTIVELKENQKIDLEKAKLHKMVYKTMPDVYDGHFHIIDPASIDDTGSGYTNSSIGSHNYAKEHRHEVKDFLVKHLQMEVESPSEGELEQYNSEAGWKNPVRNGIFYSEHYSYSGSTDIKVSKNFRKELPDEAFALKSLRMIPHHYKNVKSTSDNLSVNLHLLKKSLEYTQSENFLENFDFDSETIEKLREEAQSHLLNHLESMQVFKKSWATKLIDKFRGRNMAFSKEKMQEIKDSFERLHKEGFEVTDENISKILGLRNDIDSIIKESGIKESFEEVENESDSVEEVSEIVENEPEALEKDKEASNVQEIDLSPLEKKLDAIFERVEENKAELNKAKNAFDASLQRLREELSSSSLDSVQDILDNRDSVRDSKAPIDLEGFIEDSLKDSGIELV